MTIAVVWQEEGRLWSAADTRLVAGTQDRPTTDIASKIYSIPIAVAAFGPDGFLRKPHYWTQYGFVYAGAALPASMTAIMASTLLQKLARPGVQVSQPRFEDISELVFRLAKRFMGERQALLPEDRRRADDGLFSAALFGWCVYECRYKVAHIEGSKIMDRWEARLNFPTRPSVDGDPWLVLGTGAQKFNPMFDEWRSSGQAITKLVPRRVIEQMVLEGADPTVGGATSLGMAHEFGFELFCGLEKTQPNGPGARLVFNGLDLESEIGQVGEYLVLINGMA